MRAFPKLVFDEIPRIAGHRGAKGSAPENTLASFQRAAEIGVRFVEFDVNLAAGGELVAFHDYDLDRCTNGSGRLVDHRYQHLACLDAGSHFSPEFAGERIPLFREVIRLLANLQIGANIEIKSLPGFETQTVHALLKDLGNHWPDDLPLLLSSFNETIMTLLAQHSAGVMRGWLVGEVPADWREKLSLFDASSFHCSDKHLRQHHVEAAINAGYSVLVYTVNERKRAGKLIDWGVACVISDNPELMLDLDQPR